MEQANKELKITFLNTNWLDSTEYLIDIEELVNSVNFIHSGRHHGGSVLVHCAQVSLVTLGLHTDWNILEVVILFTL